MHLAMAQAPVKRGDIAANLASAGRLVAAAQETCDGRLDLLALPELFLTGYLLRDDLHRVAEPLPPLPPLRAPGAEAARAGAAPEAADADALTSAGGFAFGPAASGLLALAAEHGVHLVAGLVEQGAAALYNVALLVGPGGYVGHYRKIFRPNFGPFEEQLHFGSGGPQTPVFATPAGRIGLQICYDAFFPQQSLPLARAGAELVLNISAGPTTSRPLFHRVLPARAIETTCFWGHANNVGPQGSLSFAGESVIYSPRGDELARAPAFAEGVAVAELPLEDLPAMREFRPLLRDGVAVPELEE